MKYALITGITGQDGSYLAEILLDKGYNVYGIIRRHSQINTQRIDHIFSRLNLIYGDMTDQTSIMTTFMMIEKNNDIDVLEIYNLAAQSHVKISFAMPEYTAQVDAIGTLRLLETILKSDIKDKVRLYQASTSELYGKVLSIPQDENTQFNPQSPYAIAKIYSYWIVKNYKTSYNIFACNGILFNHTSPRRGEIFVCRKITIGIARIMTNRQDILILGNLNAKRDLGHAKDYVYGMWLMLQNKEPIDYVLSTGETYSVREIVQMAFNYFNKTIIWEGDGVDEVGLLDGKIVITVSPNYFRPSEVDFLLGCSKKAETELGWKRNYTIQQIINEMIEHDLNIGNL
jgi:GDPmannose 4,6-dehydratase